MHVGIHDDGTVMVPPEMHWGYEDGFEGRPERLLDVNKYCISCYEHGFNQGAADREEIDRANSSNT